MLFDLPEVAQAAATLPQNSVTLLGRLAVAARCQGQGFGRLLLVDALRRSARQATEIASAAVIVDAIDESAVKFYQRYHFLALPETPRTLFLEMATIQKLFE